MHFGHEIGGENDAVMRNWIQHGLILARSYGIVTESDVCRFLEYMDEFGNSFHQAPQVASVLQVADILGFEKMDKLDAYVAFALRS